MRKRSGIFYGIIFLIFILTGCAMSRVDSAPAGSSPAPVSEEGSEYAAAPESEEIPVTQIPEAISETPASDPISDAEEAEALRIAVSHGLLEEDLRGRYDLFLRFDKAIEENSGLDGYEEYVYRIFPVVADQEQYIDTDYLLERLGYLEINETGFESGDGGVFYDDANMITINTNMNEEDRYQRPSVVFHELMHFVDFSAGPEREIFYYFNGEAITFDEFTELPSDEMSEALPCYETSYLVEGGAETYTAKYLAGAVRAYFIPCQFLTGLEYIYGGDVLDRSFFRRESDALMAEIFLEAGYSADRYFNANESLNWLTYPERYSKPDPYIPPEDILIDLYESRLGDGWKTDEYFLYILKTMNIIGVPCAEESAYADFLNGIEFSSFDSYYRFEGRLYAGLPAVPTIRYIPPSPVILNGRNTIGAFAEWTDEKTQETVHGTISVEYDFGKEEPVNYELLDMDAMLGQ